MICAWCGKEKELCGSVRIDGVMQPRPCKECLIGMMNGTVSQDANMLYWLHQLDEDPESLEAIKKMGEKA